MRSIVSLFLLIASCVAQITDAKSLYEQAMNKLTGVPPNRSELTGIDLMSRSADMGYPPAQVALGFIYDTGMFVAGSPSKAADLYRKAAGQGSHLAEYLLGRMYFVGLLGGGRREGEKWLELAAESGNPFAAYLLGVSLYERDPAAAMRWFRVGAEQGIPHAQYRLAKAYLDGRAAPVDKHQAYLWLYVSREAGIGEAGTDMSLLESSLGTEETGKAKMEARELQDHVRRSANAKQCTGWNGEFDIIPAAPPLNLQRYCE